MPSILWLGPLCLIACGFELWFLLRAFRELNR